MTSGRNMPTSTLVALITLLLLMNVALAQAPADPAKLLAAQRDAMKKLAFMHGQWRGSAWIIKPDGQKHELTQTERVGPFLDGSVKVVEGRGYDADGNVAFSALGVVSFNPSTGMYTMSSWAQGQSGVFSLTPNTDGFTWEIPAGPAIIRYTTTIKDGAWHEVGDRILPGKAPVRFFEMTLKRVGDTDWPAEGAVPAK